MSQSQNGEAEHPGKKMTIRGQKCSKWTEFHQKRRNDHQKILLGTINPEHSFVDPRKGQEQLALEPKVKKLALEEKKLFEKPYLPEHLTNPYVHIKRVVKKVENHTATYAYQNDIWNKSTNVKSTRQIYQIPKPVKSQLTKSC